MNLLLAGGAVYMDGKFAGMGEADENGLIRFRAMLMEMNECE